MEKKANDKLEKVDLLDKYMCTTYIWMHLLVTFIYTMITVVATTFISKAYTWYICVIGTILFTIMLLTAYMCSKRLKQKKNKLNQHKVKLIRQVIYVMLTLVWMCVISMIFGLSYIMIMFK